MPVKAFLKKRLLQAFSRNAPGEKACDSNRIIEDMNARGALVCMSQRPWRNGSLEIGPVKPGWRQMAENVFCNLKEIRRIAMRSDKTDTGFSAMIHACVARINSR